MALGCLSRIFFLLGIALLPQGMWERCAKGFNMELGKKDTTSRVCSKAVFQPQVISVISSQQSFLDHPVPLPREGVQPR